MGNLSNIKNVVVYAPQPGDILILDTDNKIRFIDFDSFDKSLMPSSTNYVGVVSDRNGEEVQVLDKNTELQPFSAIYLWDATGFILDGAEHESKITLSSSADVKPSNPIFKYSGTTLEAISDQLNTWLSAYNEEAKKDYWCYPENDSIRMILGEYDAWWQYDFRMSGIELTNYSTTYMTGYSEIYSGNGKSGAYKSMNFEKFVSYVRDSTSPTFNPSGKLTSVPTYPTSLAFYISDNGSYLRSIYGEGEEGYIAFMHGYELVFPSHRGVLGPKYRDGLAITKKLASATYKLRDGSIKPVFPAATYCQNISYPHRLLGAGRWHLPTMHDFMQFVPFLRIDYSDRINRALEAIGGTHVYWLAHWSSCRCGSADAWVFGGNAGCTGSNGFYYRSWVRPCLLLHLSECED